MLAQAYATSARASIRRAMAKVESAVYENTAIVLNPVDYAVLSSSSTPRATTATTRHPTTPAHAPSGVCPQPSFRPPRGFRDAWRPQPGPPLDPRERAVAITETNEDDFKPNLFVARAEMRAAFGNATPGVLAMVKLNNTVAFPGA
ncbi:hypothetical protein [Salinibacterium sp. TMP30]|uniref:hypothetical protein n=1 Tax=Salinibacterium sp. TMP30 TaxID=3138237 RepID=UPI003138CF2E